MEGLCEEKDRQEEGTKLAPCVALSLRCEIVCRQRESRCPSADASRCAVRDVLLAAKLMRSTPVCTGTAASGWHQAAEAENVG